MSVEATIVDDQDTTHLIIGLTKETVEALLHGGVLVIPSGPLSLSEESEIIVTYGETDKEITSRMKADYKSVKRRGISSFGENYTIRKQ